jgi:hypothetical protein
MWLGCRAAMVFCDSLNSRRPANLHTAQVTWYVSQEELLCACLAGSVFLSNWSSSCAPSDHDALHCAPKAMRFDTRISTQLLLSSLCSYGQLHYAHRCYRRQGVYTEICICVSMQVRELVDEAILETECVGFNEPGLEKVSSVLLCSQVCSVSHSISITLQLLGVAI